MWSTFFIPIEFIEQYFIGADHSKNLPNEKNAAWKLEIRSVSVQLRESIMLGITIRNWFLGSIARGSHIYVKSIANSNNETLSEWLIIIISPIPCDKRTIEQYNNFWRRRQQQRRCRLVFDSGGPPCFRHKITFVFVAFGHWFGTNTAKTKHFSIKICARVHPGCCAWVCLCLCHFATVTFGVALLLAPEYEQLNNRKTGRTTIQYAYYVCRMIPWRWQRVGGQHTRKRK